MPIVVTCPCGQSSEAPDSAAGRHGSCPACGRAVTVPAPAIGPVVVCRCGQRFRAEARLIGTVVTCPACRQSISVPHPAAQSIFDEMPAGPIAARPAPPPAVATQLGPSRAPERRPRVLIPTRWIPFRLIGGSLLLTWAAFQTAWLLYNVFVEMLISKPWLIPIGIPFLIALWTLGLKLVMPKSRDDG